MFNQGQQLRTCQIYNIFHNFQSYEKRSKVSNMIWKYVIATDSSLP